MLSLQRYCRGFQPFPPVRDLNSWSLRSTWSQEQWKMDCMKMRSLKRGKMIKISSLPIKSHGPLMVLDLFFIFWDLWLFYDLTLSSHFWEMCWSEIIVQCGFVWKRQRYWFTSLILIHILDACEQMHTKQSFKGILHGNTQTHSFVAKTN